MQTLKQQLAILYGKTIKAIKKLFGYQIGLIKPLKALHLYLTKNLKTRTANVMGHTMFLDRNDDLSLSINGEFEPMETSIVKKMVKPGDYVIDIGANIGYYTLIMAKLVGETGKVFAFEPDPENVELLKKNVEYNGYKNVVIFPYAVSDQEGAIKLYLSDTRHADNRIYDFGDGRKSIDIKAVRVDDMIADRIDFIKMDIEGSEIGAIKGMKRILRDNNLSIISEFWPQGIKKFGYSAQEFLDILENLGYSFADANEETLKIDIVDKEYLLNKYKETEDVHTNILCFKE